MTKLPERILS